MAEGTSHKKTYYIIFGLLAFFTFIELFIPDMNATTMVKGSLLSAVALIKAFMVMWWFMHLNEERGWLKFIAMIPIAAFIYAFVVVLESLYR